MTVTYPDQFNLAEYCIGKPARERPTKTALLVYNVPNPTEAIEEWRFSDIERAVLQIAASLGALGLKRGDRIAIRLGNSSRAALLFFGAIAGGYVALPLSEQLAMGELRGLLEDSGACAIAALDGLPDEAVPSGVLVLSAQSIEDMIRDQGLEHNGGSQVGYAATRANDPAYMLYTSGTTANPKGVVHAHRVGLGRSPTYQGWYGITPDDRMLHTGAFNWTYTLGTGLIDPWANGATSIVFSGEKKPEIWPPLIRATGATLFAAVPSLIRQILKYAPPGPLDLGDLRHALIAGERPPEDLFAQWRERTGTELYEALGMSEISTYISTSPSVPRKPGTAGKAQPGRRIVILPVDEGETPLPAGEEGLIAIHRSDPGLMLGYWNRPLEEAAVYRGEWFLGGDLGVMDDDGYITHTGRANDIMKALGYRVAPQEVEAVIAQCPGVAEVACAEIQVRSDVSVIGAFVVRKPGSSVDAADIVQFFQARLAGYKHPREIVFLDALPRTANGKIRRNALAAARITSSLTNT